MTIKEIVDVVVGLGFLGGITAVVVIISKLFSRSGGIAVTPNPNPARKVPIGTEDSRGYIEQQANPSKPTGKLPEGVNAREVSGQIEVNPNTNETNWQNTGGTGFGD